MRKTAVAAATGGREGEEDPGPHSKTVGKFPLTSHVRHDAEEEVKDNELILATYTYERCVCTYVNEERKKDSISVEYS